MMMAALKWGVPTIMALLVIASFSTRKVFHVETTVDAPPQAVWAVLMDTAAYPSWNPTVVHVDGTYEIGVALKTKVKDPDGKILEMTNTVTALERNKELRQKGGLPGIITYDHQWLLEPFNGGTKIIQHEVDRGALLWFWNSDWIEPAYLRASEALADRVLQITEEALKEGV